MPHKIQRPQLQDKVNQWCKCTGRVARLEEAKYNMGINLGIPATLLESVTVDGVTIDHLWVKDAAMSAVPAASYVQFTAIVLPYSKKLGKYLSFQLCDVRELRVSKKRIIFSNL